MAEMNEGDSGAIVLVHKLAALVAPEGSDGWICLLMTVLTTAVGSI